MEVARRDAASSSSSLSTSLSPLGGNGAAGDVGLESGAASWAMNGPGAAAGASSSLSTRTMLPAAGKASTARMTYGPGLGASGDSASSRRWAGLMRSGSGLTRFRLEPGGLPQRWRRRTSSSANSDSSIPVARRLPGGAGGWEAARAQNHRRLELGDAGPFPLGVRGGVGGDAAGGAEADGAGHKPGTRPRPLGLTGGLSTRKGLTGGVGSVDAPLRLGDGGGDP